jgi:hypothetical protein
MVLLCQYIEFTYYGGHRREHMAGTCRIDEDKALEQMEHVMDADGNVRLRKKKSKFYMTMAKRLSTCMKRRMILMRWKV